MYSTYNLEANHFWCCSCLKKIGVMTISIKFVLVFEEKEKESIQL
jgi:hypothetical protein